MWILFFSYSRLDILDIFNIYLTLCIINIIISLFPLSASVQLDASSSTSSSDVTLGSLICAWHLSQ